ncbi:Hydrolase [Burkholderiales bacterium]|nr:Hydrolase [Burkholderiales bacterium]
MISTEEYVRHDGLSLAALVRSGQVSCAELLQTAIARIEAHNPVLNAVIRKRYEQAQAEAAQVSKEAPLAGVPFLVKDLIATIAGEPTGSGNRLMAGISMPHDSEMVRRYRAAGLVIVGRTNTPEFGLTPYTEPTAFGVTRNPWSAAHSPGGSSGGSAAAVAARLVPMASGGDGGGSIRIPASCCGLFGLKPSRGRTPTGPDFGELWRGFAIENVVSRSVRDSAAMLDATAGADAGAPYAAPAQARPFLEEVRTDPGRLRIAFTGQPLFGRNVHADCIAGLQATARELESLGHIVEEAAPPVDAQAYAIAFVTVLAGEVRVEIEEASRAAKMRPHASHFEAATYSLGLLGRAISAAEYVSAARTLQRAARDMAPFFERYDVLLTPTLGAPPALIGSLQPSAAELRVMRIVNALDAGWLLNALGVIKPLADKTFDYVPFTPLFNVTGQPAMSVPLHWNDAGLPVGMQFVARFGDEATLFRLAGQLEQAKPWFDRVPVGF